MIVIMDMSSGTRLDDEESLPFLHQCPATEPVTQAMPQLGNQLDLPQLGLQLAVPEPRSVLRAPARSAAMWLMPISEEMGH